MDDNNGTILITTDMEYRLNTSGSWTSGTGLIENILAGTTYYVRLKATASAFTSQISTVTINSFTATKENPPNASIDFENEELKGLTAGGYTVNGNPITVTGTTYSISNWIGISINIVKVGNGITTIDSDPQNISVPARPVITNEISATACTTTDDNDGTITGVTITMEYKLKTSSSWISCTETIITGLVPGVYEVRVKAAALTFRSITLEVIVGAYTGEIYTIDPPTGDGYTAELISGNMLAITVAASYSKSMPELIVLIVGATLELVNETDDTLTYEITNIFADVAIMVTGLSINKYTVTFKNWDETELAIMENVEHGSSVTAPTDPTRESHTFIGWNKPLDNITGDYEIFALFSPQNNNQGISEPVLWTGVGIALVMLSGLHVIWVMKKPKKKQESLKHNQIG